MQPRKVETMEPVIEPAIEARIRRGAVEDLSGVRVEVKPSPGRVVELGAKHGQRSRGAPKVCVKVGVVVP